MIINAQRLSSVLYSATYWQAPIRSEVLSNIANAATNLAAVKSCMHLTSRFEYDKGGTNKITDLNPSGLTGVHRITLPHSNAFSKHYEVVVWYQAHGNDTETDSESANFGKARLPSISLRLKDVSLAFIDPTPVQNNAGATWATTADTHNGHIDPEAGDLRGQDEAIVQFPVLCTHFTQHPGATVATGALPTPPRALLSYNNYGTGDPVVLEIGYEHARVLQVDINEAPGVSV